MGRSAKKTPPTKWIDQAIKEFSPKKLSEEDALLFSQYKENARFLGHIKSLAQDGALRAGELRTLQQAFAKAKRRDDDPMLALEVAYLGIIEQHGNISTRH